MVTILIDQLRRAGVVTVERRKDPKSRHERNVVLVPLDADAKLRTLDEITGRLGLGRADALCAGDGANDIPMIRAAGLGVGFRPHARVAEVAPVVIRYGDLTALLFIQGYPRSAFAAG